MTGDASPELSSLASRLLGRRHELLAHTLSNSQNSVAADRARRQLVGPGVAAETAAVWREAFLKYGVDVTQELLELVLKSEKCLTSAVAGWIRTELHRNLDETATGMSASLREIASRSGGHGAGVGTIDALSSRLSRDINSALITAQRDVDIALDKAVLESRPKSDPDPPADPALTDVLLALKNRRAFEHDLTVLLQTARVNGEPFAVVVFDIDHFKKVNDEHGGHQTGDEALRDVAARAESVVRGKGSAYRYGGDEFALLLPNHTAQEALAVAERLRVAVTSTPVTSRALTVSVSVGIALFPDHGADADALKKAADGAAYDAKKLGRDLVRVHGEAPPDVPRSREPERKEPVPGGLTEGQMNEIRLHFFRHGWAACPHDEARLDVIDMTEYGQDTKKLRVSCPFCGLVEQVG